MYKKKLAKATVRSREVSTRLYQEKSRLQSKLDEAKANIAACSICFGSTGGLVCFYPCGHASVCISCSPALTACPQCRTDIELRAPLFLVCMD